jgi:serine protein kinase
VTVAGETVESLCKRYVASLRAYASQPGSDQPLDEPLLRAVEDKMEIPDARRDELRREALNLIDALTAAGRTFEPATNRRVGEALAAVLAENQPA